MNRKLENNKVDKHVHRVVKVATILNVTNKTFYTMIEKGQLQTVMLRYLKVLSSSLKEKLVAKIEEIKDLPTNAKSTRNIINFFIQGLKLMKQDNLQDNSN